MKKYIVEVSKDFNENKGGMKFDKDFDTYEEAYNYIQTKRGIMGSTQDTEPRYTWNFDDVTIYVFNGRQIRVYKEN